MNIIYGHARIIKSTILSKKNNNTGVCEIKTDYFFIFLEPF